MLHLIALVYLLLCVRFRVQFEASLAEWRGGASLCIGALGVCFRREYVLAREKGRLSFSMRLLKGKIRRKPKKRLHSALWRRVSKALLIDTLHAGRFERLSFSLGLGDACETAVVSGAVHALLCSLLAASGAQGCELRVTPDFSKTGLYACIAGIFSFQPGDIMLAALKQAQRKRARD